MPMNNAVSFDEKMLYTGYSLRADGYVGVCSLWLQIDLCVCVKSKMFFPTLCSPSVYHHTIKVELSAAC